MNLGYWGNGMVEVEKDIRMYICNTIYIYTQCHYIQQYLSCFPLWVKFPGTMEFTLYMRRTLGEDRQLRMPFETIQFKRRK